MDAENYGEPWQIDGKKFAGYGWENKVLNAAGGVVIRDGMDELDIQPVVFSDDELRRVVACVNACQGIPTEKLEAGYIQESLEMVNNPDNWM